MESLYLVPSEMEKGSLKGPRISLWSSRKHWPKKQDTIFLVPTHLQWEERWHCHCHEAYVDIWAFMFRELGEPIPLLKIPKFQGRQGVRGHYISTTIHLHTPSRPPTSIGIRTVTSSLIWTFLNTVPKRLLVDITRPYWRVLHLLYLDHLLSGPRVVTWGLLYIR